MKLRVPQGDANVVQQPRQGSEFENSILQEGEAFKMKKNTKLRMLKRLISPHMPARASGHNQKTDPIWK